MIQRQVAAVLSPVQDIRSLVAALTPILRDHGHALNQIINGFLAFEVVLTGDLPAAGAAMDGRLLIEDVGAGNRNLVFYIDGLRFRLTGSGF